MLRGQATVELMGVLPLLALAALACVQAALLALTSVYAQAGADWSAHAARRDVTPVAAQLPVPRAWRHGAKVERRSQGFRVVLRSPAMLPKLPPLAVAAEAAA